jgi:hypothetical protein
MSEDKIIETPDLSVAKYDHTDEKGNRIYFDGIAYWSVDKSGMIKQVE